jgi:hypothetical protein
MPFQGKIGLAVSYVELTLSLYSRQKYAASLRKACYYQLMISSGSV